MANLDITELLSDPDLCDRFQYVRQTEQVDANGYAQRNAITRRAYGSVQPASGQTLKLFPNLTNVTGAIEIWTKAPLQIATATLQSDLVLWKNATYIVAERLDDWTHFGVGFVHAVCTLQSLESQGTDGMNGNATQ